MYLAVGKMITLSILHGGPGPVFFAPVVIDYLFGDIAGVKACVEDVPDRVIQSKLKRVGSYTCMLASSIAYN